MVVVEISIPNSSDVKTLEWKGRGVAAAAPTRKVSIEKYEQYEKYEKYEQYEKSVAVHNIICYARLWYGMFLW